MYFNAPVNEVFKTKLGDYFGEQFDENFLTKPDISKEVSEKEQLVDTLGEYNLFLLRTVYESFEGDRGDRVIQNFRKDNFNILKKTVFMMLSMLPEPKKKRRRVFYQETIPDESCCHSPSTLASDDGVLEEIPPMDGEA
jgi:hypothetical protein